jgi:hypothetical protein
MVRRMRTHKLDTVAEARRELAAEAREVASLLESEEPDYLVLHDSWEALVGLAERTERMRIRLLQDQPEQEVWLIEKRPWLDPKLKLVGIPKKRAAPSSSPSGPRPSRTKKEKSSARSSA